MLAHVSLITPVKHGCFGSGDFGLVSVAITPLTARENRMRRFASVEFPCQRQRERRLLRFATITTGNQIAADIIHAFEEFLKMVFHVTLPLEAYRLSGVYLLSNNQRNVCLKLIVFRPVAFCS